MEFDQLKAFYWVAKLQSFTQAARKLFVSQPAISLQVKALEKELAEKLFERVGRRVSLTNAGQIVFRKTEEVFLKVDEIHSVMSELSQLERGRFTLGTSDTTSLYFIPELIKEFLRAHPNIELQIVNRISQEIIRGVIDCEIDLGIVSLPVEEARFTVAPLIKHPLACVVASDHPLAGRKLVRPADLAPHRMVALERSSTTQKRIDRFLADHGVTLRTVVELGSFETIKKFVAIGLGIAIIPERATRSGADGIRTVHFAKPPHIELGAVYRKDRFLPHPARAFLELARAHFSPR